jgi:hypothetical protein
VAIDTNSLRYGGNGAGAAVTVSPLSLDVPPLCAVVLEATP